MFSFILFAKLLSNNDHLVVMITSTLLIISNYNLTCVITIDSDCWNTSIGCINIALRSTKSSFLVTVSRCDEITLFQRELFICNVCLIYISCCSHSKLIIFIAQFVITILEWDIFYVSLDTCCINSRNVR